MLVSVSVEPKFSKKQIIVCATTVLDHAPYKPVTFKSEAVMWECLRDLGITKIREFGNSVEWLDEISTETLERWGFIRVPVTRTKREANTFFVEVISEQLDEPLFQAGFKRRAKSSKYVRTLTSSKQSILFNFKNMQNYAPGEVWVNVEAHMFELDQVARDFLKVSENYVKTRSTFKWDWKKNCPLEFADLLEFYDRESLVPPIQKVRSCLVDYLLPVLDRLGSAPKLVKGFESDPDIAKVDADESVISLLILSYIARGEVELAFRVLKQNELLLSEGERCVYYERFSRIEDNND